MPKIILDGNVTDSDFDVQYGSDLEADATNVLLPMKTWLEQADKLKGRNDIGIWLDADGEPEEIADHVNSFAVIGLNFPTFFDGRCLSTANILRRKYGYKGELRAIGDVRRDQLEQMRRCGINAFQLAEGQDADAATSSLTSFTVGYQATVDQPEPLFRRR